MPYRMLDNWSFPLLSFFRGLLSGRGTAAGGKSIKDHRIVYGQPNYISNYEISIDKNSTPFTIEFAYDVVLDGKERWQDEWHDVEEWPAQKGQHYGPNQNTIDSMQSDEHNLAWIVNQKSPR